MAGGVGIAVALAAAAGTFLLTRGGTTSGQITGCLLSVGPLNDRSFNQATYDGLTRAVTDIGITVRARESNSKKQDAAVLRDFVGQNCSLIVAPPNDATTAAAQLHPDQKFLVFDPFEPPPLPNMLGVEFRVQQAAFLSGYLAAGTTKTGTVATFGGVPIPTVLPYMDGFAAGILKYNQDQGASVRLVGWDPAAGKGAFISQSDFHAFGDVAGGRRIAESLIARGADIIFPVAGGAGVGAGDAARDAGGVFLVGVDFDQFYQTPQFADLFLTSVRKRYDVAMEDVMKLVVDGAFKGGGLFSGTLANGSVDLAPFHDLDGSVSKALRDRLAELKAGIIDGSISVDPRDYLP